MTWGIHFQSCHPEKLHPAATQPWKCQHPQGSSGVRTRASNPTPGQAVWASSGTGMNPWLQTVKPPRDQEIWTGRVLSTGICALNKATSLRAASLLCQHKSHLPHRGFSHILQAKQNAWRGASPGKGWLSPHSSLEYSRVRVLCRGGQVAHSRDSKLWGPVVVHLSPQNSTQAVNSPSAKAGIAL